MMRRITAVILAGLLGLGMGSAYAGNITVDQIIADPVTGTLSGDVNMSLSGNTLTILLQNTSSSSSSGAGVILSGIGFDMPGSVDIASGSVRVGANSFVRGGSLNGQGVNTVVSGEWGYANGAQGHFNGVAVDSLVSAMEADTDFEFAASIDPPNNTLNGPAFGLLATGGLRGGLTAIENTVEIRLFLSGNFNSAQLINQINSGHVALTFGSPTGGSVPDGGTTLVLLGSALAGLGALRRKLA